MNWCCLLLSPFAMVGVAAIVACVVLTLEDRARRHEWDREHQRARYERARAGAK